MKVYELWRCPSCGRKEMVYIHDDMIIPPICGSCHVIRKEEIEMEILH